MAGMGREDDPVEVQQVRGVVAVLIDALEEYAVQARSSEARRYLAEAQRFAELGSMMAVKGLYVALDPNQADTPQEQ